MSDLRQKVDDLNNRILNGDILGAFEDYYADDVVMIDAGQPPREGKDTNREYEKVFVEGLTEFRGAELKSSVIDEEQSKVFNEWHFDFTHAQFGDQKYDQVAVQIWEDGKVKEERFYKL